MARREPVAEPANIGMPVSEQLTRWDVAVRCLTQARNYWLATVRPDGRPHVAPLWGVWLDDALYFCTAQGSRKARNFALEPRCCVSIDSETLQVVIEGRVSRTSDEGLLRSIGEFYGAKYGRSMTPKDGSLTDASGNSVPVYAVELVVAFGYGYVKEAYSATRWRFE